jgi:glycogen synthase
MRGLARGLQNHGLEVIKASSTNDGDVSGEDVSRLNAGELPKDFDPGVIFVFNPSFHMTSKLRRLDAKIVGMHVGDVSSIPHSWALAIENETLTIVPSKWMLHTFELTLVVPEVRRLLKQAMEKQSLDAGRRTSIIKRPYGMTPQELIELYQSHHVLLVPSRAEGFGIQSLEARSLGCVVVQTTCTGHEDHFKKDEVPLDFGVVPIPHGPLDVAWGDFGLAPTVKAESIATAIHYASQNYRQLRLNAVMNRPMMSRWSWENVTEELAERIKAL